MRPLICLLTLLLTGSASFATHYLGGYIQSARIDRSTLRYKVTVVVYYDARAGGTGAPSTTLSVCFGDQPGTTLLRPTTVQQWAVDKNVSVAEYSTSYVYAAPGVYTLQATGTNRTASRNTGDGEQPFALQTTVLVQGGTVNTTPVLQLPPAGLEASLRQRVVLNLATTDADNDSLSYALAYPLTTPDVQFTPGGVCETIRPLATYQFPNAVGRAGTYQINARTGLLNWDVPVTAGRYSLAIVVSEWRLGILTSRTQQELVLTVVDKGGTPVAPPPYVPAVQDLITAVADADPVGLALSISPNPVGSGRVEVVLTSNIARPATLQVLDSRGRVYLSAELGTFLQRHQYQFDMSSQPAGLYLIRAESGGRQVVQKLVKQ